MIFLSIYYLLGIILLAGILKFENGMVQVKHIPPVLGLSLVWPPLIFFWIMFTIDERWGDKKIL